MTAPAIQFEGDRLAIHFEQFDLASYELFLKTKSLPEYRLEFVGDGESYRVTAPARFASLLDESVAAPQRSNTPLADFLFDDQQAVTTMALEAKRFAYWGDCGLGKTNVGLEYGRQVHQRTDGRVLYFTLNEIVPQWIEECEKFYGDSMRLHRLSSREEMKAWAKGEFDAGTPFAITNYEKMNPSDGEQVVHELKHLAGVVPDEADRLKTGGGKQKWALIHSCKGIEYKLSLTATPAPNDWMEYASQGSFLEKMRSGNEILWTFFAKDEKTGKWTVKPHARESLFEFMASWAIYIRDPRKYGWRQGFPDIPEPEYFYHPLTITNEQQQLLQRYTRDSVGQQSFFDHNNRNAIDRVKLAQVARGFLYNKDGSYTRVTSMKPKFAAELAVNDSRAGRQVIVWTEFDAESELICEHLTRLGVDFATLHGSTKPAVRQETRESFRKGNIPILVTKAKLLGYGQNFQNATSNVISGFNDSFVELYQLIRRTVRFGQKETVWMHLPYIAELEWDRLENLQNKGARHEAAVSRMEDAFIAARGRLWGVAA